MKLSLSSLFLAATAVIVTPDRVANLAFGDADSKTLYMVGGRSLWRIRVNIPGIRPMAAAPGSY